MNDMVQLLAKRYAIAYLNLFGQQFDLEVHNRFMQADRFFADHPRVSYFLSLPTIADEQKYTLMEELAKKCELPESSMRLLKLLIEQKRAWLWPEIVSSIITLYQERNGIQFMHLEAAPELNEQEQKAFIAFLARKIGQDIIYSYTVNTDLIAGIRAQSDTLLWEYSIAQKLRALRLSLIH